MRYEEALTDFRDSLKVRNYSEKTQETYLKMLEGWRAFLTERSKDDLRAVTKEDILAYQETLAKGPLSKATQALKVRALKRLFEHLCETNKLLLNPAEGVRETPRGHRLPQPVLTQEEMKKLLLTPNLSLRVGIRDRALLELLYATGIRVGEMERLTIHDVDLLSGVLHVRRGKGGRARVLPLGKQATRWLKEYLDKVRPFFNRHNPQERALFLTLTGRALRQEIVRPLVTGYAKKAGIKKNVSPHLFRHTCATHLLQAGADIVSLQRLLGHRHIDSTVLYTRVMPVELKTTHRETHPRERGMR